MLPACSASPRPLIAPGIYDATCITAKRKRLGRAPKLILLFDLAAPADTDLGVRRVRLARYYNVTDLPGGRLRAGRSSDYARDWMRCTGRRITRSDRLDPTVFLDAVFSVEVSTVNRDRDHRPLPPCAWYSKIRRLLERKTGGAR